MEDDYMDWLLDFLVFVAMPFIFMGLPLLLN